MTPNPIATFSITPSAHPDRPGVVALVYPPPRRRLALAPIAASDMAARRADAGQRVARAVSERIERINSKRNNRSAS